jgi:hypothetical protein
VSQFSHFATSGIGDTTRSLAERVGRSFAWNC